MVRNESIFVLAKYYFEKVENVAYHKTKSFIILAVLRRSV